MPEAARAVENPYVGPVSFTEGQTLYGRDHEMDEIEQLLVAERIVLLRSPSGAGKTSLIQAKLVPKMRDETGFRVWPIMRVNTVPPKGYQGNRYLYSCLEALRQRGAAAGESLEAVLGTPQPVDLLIFDQFEEVLTLDATDIDAKREFFAAVGECLRNRKRWALFSMREEHVASLDAYLRYLPTRLATVYRLDRLDVDRAQEAIQCPARDAGVTFTDAAARQLAIDLSTTTVQREDGSLEAVPGNYVEPVQLQVVCSTLWTKPRADPTVIDEADLGTTANLNTALAEYYSDRVGKIARSIHGVTGDGDSSAERSNPAPADEQASAASIESERGIRQWFERRLISPPPQSIRLQVLKGSREQELPDGTISALISAYLIRPEKRLNATWYELSHDRLIRPVVESNAAWRKRHGDAFRELVELWEAQHFPDSLLLRGPDLEKAFGRDRSRLNPLELDFLERSRGAQRRADAEKRQALIVRMALVAAVVLAIFASYQWWVATAAKKEADAESAKAIAESAKADAESAKADAESKKADAESQKATSASQDAERQALLANEALAQVKADRALEARNRQDWPVMWIETLDGLSHPVSSDAGVSSLLGLLLLTEGVPGKDWRAVQEASVIDFRRRVTPFQDVRYEIPVAFWAGLKGRMRFVVMRDPVKIDPMRPVYAETKYSYRFGGYPDDSGAASWTGSGAPQPDRPDLFVFSPDGTQVLSWIGGIATPQGGTNGQFAMQPFGGAPKADGFASATPFKNPVRQLSLRGDGRQMAAVQSDGSILLRTADSGQKPQDNSWTPLGGSAKLGFTSIAYSPGNRFAAGTSGGIIHIWPAAGSSAPPLNCEIRSGSAQQLAFSPVNEQLLAVADDAGTLTLWKAPPNGRCELLAGVSIAPEGFQQIGFTPNGDTIVTLSRSGVVRRMPLRLHVFDRDVNIEQILFAPDAPEPRKTLAAILNVSLRTLQRSVETPQLVSASPQRAAQLARAWYGAIPPEAFSFGPGGFAALPASGKFTWRPPTTPNPSPAPIALSPSTQSGDLPVKPGIAFRLPPVNATTNLWQLVSGKIGAEELMVDLAQLNKNTKTGALDHSGFSLVHREIGFHDGWQTTAMDGSPFYFAEIAGENAYRTFQLRAASFPQNAELQQRLVLRIPAAGGMSQIQTASGWADFAYATRWKPFDSITTETVDHDEAARPIVFSRVSLNGQGKAIAVAPGSKVAVDLHWKVRPATNPPRDSMLVQSYYGIGDMQNTYLSRCFISAYPGLRDADDHAVLSAPKLPGVYYITVHYWDLYSCAVTTYPSNDWNGSLGSVLVREK
ncbi:MAG TPA: hypothetical protein VKU19_16935 [Bryobacteraceae bacterium]|nr:hypothetical protein [Bryobacteraceae bacterium]